MQFLHYITLTGSRAVYVDLRSFEGFAQACLFIYYLKNNCKGASGDKSSCR